MSKVIITAAIELNPAEIDSIKNALDVKATDEVIIKTDSSLIAGLTVTKNGKTIDLSVKKQLSDIARE